MNTRFNNSKNTNSESTNGNVSSGFSASIMSAVTKVYLDGKNIPYTVSSDENDRFTDIFEVNFPLDKNTRTKVTITTSTCKKVTFKAPEFNYEYNTPDTMRPSEFQVHLPRILNTLVEIWEDINSYGGRVS